MREPGLIKATVWPGGDNAQVQSGFGVIAFCHAYHCYLVRAAESSRNESETELAMELQNPVASLVSVPLQNNMDFGIGPASAMR